MPSIVTVPKAVSLAARVRTGLWAKVALKAVSPSMVSVRETAVLLFTIESMSSQRVM